MDEREVPRRSSLFDDPEVQESDVEKVWREFEERPPTQDEG